MSHKISKEMRRRASGLKLNVLALSNFSTPTLGDLREHFLIDIVIKTEIVGINLPTDEIRQKIDYALATVQHHFILLNIGRSREENNRQFAEAYKALQGHSLQRVPWVLWINGSLTVKYDKACFFRVLRGHPAEIDQLRLLLDIAEMCGLVTPSVFMSHSHSDKPFVRKLSRDLKARNIFVWVDDAEIAVGDSLIEKIREAIDSIDYVAAIISNSSLNSEWVKRELDIAMNQEIESRRVKVLPLLVDECDLPGFLKGKLYADFTSADHYSKSLKKLVRKIRSKT